MISDVEYRLDEIEGESETEREVRVKVGLELWEKWKRLQNSIEEAHRSDAIEKWKIEQSMIERQLEALNWSRGDIWDSYNEEAPMRRAMEARAQARDSDMMEFYDDPYDDDRYYPEDD